MVTQILLQSGHLRRTVFISSHLHTVNHRSHINELIEDKHYSYNSYRRKERKENEWRVDSPLMKFKLWVHVRLRIAETSLSVSYSSCTYILKVKRKSSLHTLVNRTINTDTEYVFSSLWSDKSCLSIWGRKMRRSRAFCLIFAVLKQAKMHVCRR